MSTLVCVPVSTLSNAMRIKFGQQCHKTRVTVAAKDAHITEQVQLKSWSVRGGENLGQEILSETHYKHPLTVSLHFLF